MYPLTPQPIHSACGNLYIETRPDGVCAETDRDADAGVRHGASRVGASASIDGFSADLVDAAATRSAACRLFALSKGISAASGDSGAF